MPQTAPQSSSGEHRSLWQRQAHWQRRKLRRRRQGPAPGWAQNPGAGWQLAPLRVHSGRLWDGFGAGMAASLRPPPRGALWVSFGRVLAPASAARPLQAVTVLPPVNSETA